ncbi:conserved hypothetical protein [Ricinus communis]|uniref:Uncharacterized protein n=1 Tax=Ricinus communis TaxID=3988 RepID=B9S3U8_RICCO|nr:conserved hypothetical protein [Ricinus communis]
MEEYLKPVNPTHRIGSKPELASSPQNSLYNLNDTNDQFNDELHSSDAYYSQSTSNTTTFSISIEK